MWFFLTDDSLVLTYDYIFTLVFLYIWCVTRWWFFLDVVVVVYDSFKESWCHDSAFHESPIFFSSFRPDRRKETFSSIFHLIKLMTKTSIKVRVSFFFSGAMFYSDWTWINMQRERRPRVNRTSLNLLPQGFFALKHCGNTYVIIRKLHWTLIHHFHYLFHQTFIFSCINFDI